MRAFFAFSTLFLAVLQGAPAQASEQCEAAGIEGIQFENTPLDYNVPCNVTILKGTQRNADKAFLMPQTTVSINRNREQAFSLRQRNDGKWVLTLGIYFPRSQSDLQLREELTDYYLHRCNQEEVRDYLNDPLNGYVKSGDSAIKLAHLPVRNIRVRIAGIPGYFDLARNRHVTPDKMADGEKGFNENPCVQTNMLEYVGKDFLAEFWLSESDKNSFVQRVTNLGVQITASVTFNARVSQGSVYGKLDLSSVAASLDAAFSASGPLGWVGEADFQAKLKSVSSEIALNMQTEGDLSGDQAANDLVTRITGLLFDAAQKTLQDSAGEKQDGVGKSEGKINVKAIVEGFRRKQSIPIQYQSLGRNQDLTYVTTSIYQDKNLTSSAKRITVSNLKGGVRLTSNMKKGDVLHLELIRKANQDVKIESVKKPLSMEQVIAMEVASFFPDLQKALATKSPSLRKAGEGGLWPRATAVLDLEDCALLGKGWCSVSAQRVWFEETQVPMFNPQWTIVNQRRSDQMKNLGISFSFNLGAHHRLEDIVSNWTNYTKFRVAVSDDERSITLTAREDLGAVHLYVHQAQFEPADLKDKYKSQEYDPKSFVQETYDLSGKLMAMRPDQTAKRVPRILSMRAPKRLVAYEFNVTGERAVETKPMAASAPAPVAAQRFVAPVGKPSLVLPDGMAASSPIGGGVPNASTETQADPQDDATAAENPTAPRVKFNPTIE